jgi:hypothetical protein
MFFRPQAAALRFDVKPAGNPGKTNHTGIPFGAQFRKATA